MKVALVQLNSQDDKSENIRKAFEYMDQAVLQKASVICLSEIGRAHV